MLKTQQCRKWLKASQPSRQETLLKPCQSKKKQGNRIELNAMHQGK